MAAISALRSRFFYFIKNKKELHSGLAANSNSIEDCPGFKPRARLEIYHQLSFIAHY